MANNALIKSSSDYGDTWTTILTLEDDSYYPVIKECLNMVMVCYYILKDGSDYHIRFIKSVDYGTNWSSPTTKISDVLFGSLGIEKTHYNYIPLTYWLKDVTDKQFLQKFSVSGDLIGSPIEI